MTQKKPPTDPEADTRTADVPFEKLLERLGSVADSLEKSDVPLEKALELYEEGVGLVRSAQARLASAETRIEELGQGGEPRALASDGQKKR